MMRPGPAYLERRHGGSTSAGLCLRATRGVLSVLILSDLRNHQANRTTAVVQLLDGYAHPRLYDCLMVTHIRGCTIA
jgi:hypothetical protein